MWPHCGPALGQPAFCRRELNEDVLLRAFIFEKCTFEDMYFIFFTLKAGVRNS